MSLFDTSVAGKCVCQKWEPPHYVFLFNVHLLELCWLTRLLPNHPMIIQEHPKFQTFCSHLPSFHSPAIFQSFSNHFLPFSCLFPSFLPGSQLLKVPIAPEVTALHLAAASGDIHGFREIIDAKAPKRTSAPLKMISIEILTYPFCFFKGKSIENQVTIFQLKFLLKSHESHCLFCWWLITVYTVFGGDNLLKDLDLCGEVVKPNLRLTTSGVFTELGVEYDVVSCQQ